MVWSRAAEGAINVEAVIVDDLVVFATLAATVHAFVKVCWARSHFEISYQ